MSGHVSALVESRLAHPDAEIFPAMQAEEYERFKESIRNDGLLEPITLLGGVILDGRHRERACRELGIEPRYVDWDPSCGITPLEWVIDRNLQRRQLNNAQKASLAVDYEKPLAAAARDREHKRKTTVPKMAQSENTSIQAKPGSEEAKSRTIAANQFGVGRMSVSRLKQVQATAPEVFERVKRGEIQTVSAAMREAELPGGLHVPARKTKQTLEKALAPLVAYMKNWNEDRLYGVKPAEARRLLKKVQELDAVLLEVERALEERAVTSRALR